MIASIMVWSFEQVSSLKFSDVCICSLPTCTGLIEVWVLIQSFKICNSCSLIGSCFRLFLNVSIPVSKSCNSTDRIKLPFSIFDGLSDVGNHSGSIGATWILLDFLSISQCSSSTGRICRNTRFSLLVLNKEGSGSLEVGSQEIISSKVRLKEAFKRSKTDWIISRGISIEDFVCEGKESIGISWIWDAGGWDGISEGFCCFQASFQPSHMVPQLEVSRLYYKPPGK